MYRPWDIEFGTGRFLLRTHSQIVAKVKITSIARFLNLDSMNKTYQEAAYNPSRLIMDLASAVCASI